MQWKCVPGILNANKSKKDIKRENIEMKRSQMWKGKTHILNQPSKKIDSIGKARETITMKWKIDYIKLQKKTPFVDLMSWAAPYMLVLTRSSIPIWIQQIYLPIFEKRCMILKNVE